MNIAPVKRILKYFLGVLILVIFVGTLYYLYAKSQEKPVVYGTQKPFVTNIVKKTVATGSVVPRNEIEIKSNLSGIIDEIYVEAGQKVKKGQLIARIKVIPNMSNLSNAENRVNRAEISYANAKKDYERNKPLFTEGVISAELFQQYELAMNNAKEELRSAQDNLMIVQKGISQRYGSSSNTLVKSTIDGMILDVPVEIGNSVIEANTFNAGTTIAIVADMNEMIFEGKVDESEVGKLDEGMPLILTLGAVEDEKFDAKLEYIAPKGIEDQGAIQFEIKAAMINHNDAFIRAGYSASADIVLDKRDSVLAIPEGLVKYNEKKKPYVEVETGNQEFEKRPVKLGLSDGINVEVLDGVDKNTSLKGAEIIETPKIRKGRGMGH